jgi:membrane-bound ClpP family serine protease
MVTSLAKEEGMKPDWNRLLYWLPRLLGILFAVFLVLLSMDVFEPGIDPIQIALAFAIHLIPAVLFLTVLWVAWRWEGLGGVGFLILAALYLFMVRGRMPWTGSVGIAGPLLVIGLLFLAVWRAKRRAGDIRS